MRKLYTLVIGLIVLVATKTNAQLSLPDLFSENSHTGSIVTLNDNATESCEANFEVSAETSSPLTKKFTAIPWHSEQKRPVYICWKFGDGKDTCIQYTNTYPGPYTVTHHYQEPGVYEVCVKIVYQGGCEARNCKVVILGEVCRADFEKIPLAVTANPLDVIFKALPWHSEDKKPKRICWYFGDGKDTCIEYPANYTGTYAVRHKYREAHAYNVCIKILYYGGCESGKCKTIHITQPDRCGANFERIPVTNTDNPFLVGLKAIPSHNNNKLPKVICWRFGDGKDTCIEYAQNFSGPYTVRHRYDRPGTYNVCVKITYYGGCESYKCKTISVTRPDECRADFEKLPITTTNEPLTVTYKALAWHNNNKKPKQICWRFGDGKDTCIQYPENYTGSYLVHHTYREPGQYEVCIKIIYYGGCESYRCKHINVGEFCRADFEKLLVNATANPLVTYFKALPLHTLNKKPKKICWTYGDGRDTCIEYSETYTGLYGVRHEYAQPGQYEVCVKILYYGGCEARKCKVIQIGEPVRCKADFERILISTVNNPLHAAFKAIPWHVENKKPKEICWKFGDGKDSCIQYGEDYTGPYVVHHRYDHPGNYEVCVKITYYGSCEATKCELVKIETPAQCRVKLFELTPSITSLTRGFYASAWSSENKRPVRICWYFGDGSDTCIQLTSGMLWQQLFIRHTYPAPGVYNACVKMLFEGGCIASDCDEVVIRPATNVCGGYMTDSLMSPRTFRFRGFGIHNPDDPVIGSRWTFGDGTAATGREVTHQYNAPGTYEVCLTIKTQRGCETKICKPLHVAGNSQSALQITPNPVVNNMHVLFYSTHNEQVMIKAVNSNGVVVRSWTRNATQGANNWDFDVSTLSTGAYTLYAQSQNQLASQLFIKAN